MLKQQQLRTKRNFKALQLPPLELSSLTPSEPQPQPQQPIANRPAPPPGAKKRPPPLLADLPPANPRDSALLTPASAPYQGGPPGTARSTGRSAIQASLTNTLARLDIKGSGAKLDLKNDDLKTLQELGHGNGGSVVKVEHVPSGTIMAKKIVLIDAKSSVRKQILRELQIIHECNSPSIVSSYGAFLAEPNICICMEYMDKGSFDGIYKKIGAIDIAVVSKLALSVLEGLTYLYDVHRIIHRDIKPSNILCNSQGEIKLCDFGVSGELINSIAHTFVGTSIYMSPERIRGAQYSIKSDVWSLGITLIELANGRFPFSGSNVDDDDDGDLPTIAEGTPTETTFPRPLPPIPGATARPSPNPPSSALNRSKSRRKSKRKSTGVSLHGEGMTMSILELMHQIVNEPAPRLGSDAEFSRDAIEFVDACLIKTPDERKTPKALLGFRWMDWARNSDFDVRAWANTF
ncbi:ste7-like protein [Amanita muscaria]